MNVNAMGALRDLSPLIPIFMILAGAACALVYALTARSGGSSRMKQLTLLSELEATRIENQKLRVQAYQSKSGARGHAGHGQTGHGNTGHGQTSTGHRGARGQAAFSVPTVVERKHPPVLMYARSLLNSDPPRHAGTAMGAAPGTDSAARKEQVRPIIEPGTARKEAATPLARSGQAPQGTTTRDRPDAGPRRIVAGGRAPDSGDTTSATKVVSLAADAANAVIPTMAAKVLVKPEPTMMSCATAKATCPATPSSGATPPRALPPPPRGAAGHPVHDGMDQAPSSFVAMPVGPKRDVVVERRPGAAPAAWSQAPSSYPGASVHALYPSQTVWHPNSAQAGAHGSQAGLGGWHEESPGSLAPANVVPLPSGLLRERDSLVELVTGLRAENGVLRDRLEGMRREVDESRSKFESAKRDLQNLSTAIIRAQTSISDKAATPEPRGARAVPFTTRRAGEREEGKPVVPRRVAS